METLKKYQVLSIPELINIQNIVQYRVKPNRNYFILELMNNANKVKAISFLKTELFEYMKKNDFKFELKNAEIKITNPNYKFNGEEYPIFEIMSLKENGIYSFLLSSNEFLSKNIIAFFSTYYLGYKELNNPDFINVLKNKYNYTSSIQLQMAVEELNQVLTNSLPTIFSKFDSSITICVVPRAKHEEFYTFNQKLFRSAISDWISWYNRQYNAPLLDGTHYILRHSDTKTTHTKNYDVEDNLPLPYVGITRNTCNIAADVCGKNILLIDDIYTKSVNVDEDCIQALYDNGAKSVILYTVAFTNKNKI
ncbi:MAG: hypothetical protein IJ759_01910 [Bacteroidales bacterium]|nr:hypothetical protein [Bacteroidales bacterium]